MLTSSSTFFSISVLICIFKATLDSIDYNLRSTSPVGDLPSLTANLDSEHMFGVVNFVEKTYNPTNALSKPYKTVEIRVNLKFKSKNFRDDAINWEIRENPTLWGNNMHQVCSLGVVTSQLLHNMTARHGPLVTRAMLIDDEIELTDNTEKSVVGSSLVIRHKNQVLACATLLPSLSSSEIQRFYQATFHHFLSGWIWLLNLEKLNVSLLYICVYPVSGSLSATKPYGLLVKSRESQTNEATKIVADLGSIYPGNPVDWEVVNLRRKVVYLIESSLNSDSQYVCLVDSTEGSPIEDCQSFILVSSARFATSTLSHDKSTLGKLDSVDDSYTQRSPGNNMFEGKVSVTQLTPFHPTFVELHLYATPVATVSSDVNFNSSPTTERKNLFFNSLQIHDKAVATNMCYNELINSNTPLNGGTTKSIDLEGLAFYRKEFEENNSSTLRIPVWVSLFGTSSIIGKSLHAIAGNQMIYEPSTIICGNLIPPNASFRRGYTKLASKYIEGFVTMVQYQLSNGYNIETVLYININYIGNMKMATSSHRFHIHENPPGNDQDDEDLLTRCKSTGAHYNPYKVDVREPKYSMQCNSNFHMRCEVGDLSKRHGEYIVGGGSRQYIDENLPLYPAEGASVIGRSFCIHHHVMTSTILACGVIELQDPVPVV